MKQRHQTEDKIIKTTRGTKEIKETIRSISRLIGCEIKALRLKQKMTRSELAKHLDVTAQQIQKYEQGIDNISIGRLALIAKTLGTKINHFYAHIKPMLREIKFMQIMPSSLSSISSMTISNSNNAVSLQIQEQSTEKVEQQMQLCHEVATNFMRIPNAQHQRAVNILIKSLSKVE